MLRSRPYVSALATPATLAALLAAGCGSSQAPTEASFRYASAGMIPVAQPGASAPASPGAPPTARPAARARTAPPAPSAPRTPSSQTTTTPSTPNQPATPSRAPSSSALTVGVALRRGTSEVAWAVRGAVSVYRSRRDRRPERRFPALNSFGVTQVFLVKRATAAWLEVFLPTRPNGSTAWVRSSSVGLTLNPYRVVVDTARHRLTTLRAGRVVMHAPAGIGKSATPTPLGLFYIAEELKMVPATGPYGTYALGLSAHSNVLQTFGTGDAQVALHGTNEPWTIGQNTSNGCVHLSDSVATWLARNLPLGTPVQIV